MYRIVISCTSRCCFCRSRSPVPVPGTEHIRPAACRTIPAPARVAVADENRVGVYAFERGDPGFQYPLAQRSDVPDLPTRMHCCPKPGTIPGAAACAPVRQQAAPFPASPCTRPVGGSSCTCQTNAHYAPRSGASACLETRPCGLFASDMPYGTALLQKYRTQDGSSEKKYYFCTVSMRLCPGTKTGVPGFDSRQSLIVSTPSAVWRLVNPDARFTNGNNSYALAA